MEFIDQFLRGLQPYAAAIPVYVLAIVAALTALFIVGYLVQGTRVWFQLRWTLSRLRRIPSRAKPAPEKLSEVFAGKELALLWVEYADTLHVMHKAVSPNGETLKEVRATVPAETFFTREVLVDSRMFDEFTKHLPGILTGLGIIGTFAGLLDGLLRFNPTSAASAVAGLKPLLDGVSHAFIASAVAISAAMFVTFISRLVLAHFYKLVEELNQRIDALYATGAGEEYLSRLVQASEKSEAHAAQLKQALVEDLTKLMTNITERQIQAQAVVSQRLGTLITGALEPPLKQMTDAIRTQAEGNTQAVSSTLEGLLSGFMAKLEDTFGGQMRGINDQLRRSVQAVDAVQQAMVKLLQDIDRSGEAAQQRLAQTLESAMTQAAANQAAMTEQMREFMVEFRRLMAEESEKSRSGLDESVKKMLEQVTAGAAQAAASQAAVTQQMQSFVAEFRQMMGEEAHKSRSSMDESVRKVLEQVAAGTTQLASDQAAMTRQLGNFAAGLQRLMKEESEKSRSGMDESVRKVLEQVSAGMAGLEELRKSASIDEANRQARLARHTEDTVGAIAGQVGVILKAVSEQVVATQRNIEAISNVARGAVEGMQEGARTMTTAAQRFETAGTAVSGVLERGAKVSADMTATAHVLQSSASALRQGFEQYEYTRKAAESHLQALTALVENAKREAGASRQMITDLERIVAQLQGAERQSLEYLEGVNKALEEAFSGFTTQLAGAISETTKQTDRHLGHGVQQLTGVVHEIAQMAGRLRKVT